MCKTEKPRQQWPRVVCCLFLGSGLTCCRMLHIHPTVKVALALDSVLSNQTVELEIAPTTDIYTKSGAPVLKYIVHVKSVHATDNSVQIVPICTRPIVGAKPTLPSLSDVHEEIPAVTVSASCAKCGNDLTEDEQAVYGNLCGLCNSTSQERGRDE